jgi:hypothetical protein
MQSRVLQATSDVSILPGWPGPPRRSTGTTVTYRDLSVEEYVSWLQQAGLDRETARFIAALDSSIARGELEADGRELAQLLGRPATLLTEVVGEADAARGELSWPSH